MELVEGVRGPDAVRYCDHCQEFSLQLVAQYYRQHESGNELDIEYSHLPECPACGGMSSNERIPA